MLTLPSPLRSPTGLVGQPPTGTGWIGQGGGPGGGVGDELGDGEGLGAGGGGGGGVGVGWEIETLRILLEPTLPAISVALASREWLPGVNWVVSREKV